MEPRRSPDLAHVDALLRVQLAAKREGWFLRLSDVPADLRSLIELVGVAEVLGLEPQREAELGEELGPDEVVQPRDPPA